MHREIFEIILNDLYCKKVFTSTMKIAYINFFPGEVLVGFHKKIAGQARAARELGLDMDFVILNDTLEEERDDIRYIKVRYHFQNGILKKMEQAFFKYKLISHAIDLNSYDMIILRYPWVDDLTCRKFYEALGHKIITEHHTNELSELKLSRKKDRSFFLRYFLEKRNAPAMLSKVAGIIGVTDEIRRIEIDKSGPKPSAVISNGISTSKVALTSFSPFNGKDLKMICIVSQAAPWHGLDRLLLGLKRYRGDVHITVSVLGNIDSVFDEAIRNMDNPRVTIDTPGMKYGDDLSVYFSMATIAMSSLGLYMNNMKEACVLKSREYVARGIPFIYAYDDPDIPDDCGFALKLPNDDTPIDLNRVIDFACRISKEKNLAEEMRRFAREHLDWRIKVKQMYDFACIVHQGTTESMRTCSGEER